MSNTQNVPLLLFASEADPLTLCVGCDAGCVAVLENVPLQGIDDKVNGERIVRACNAHDALVEACEGLLQIITGPVPSREWRLLRVEEAQAAIAKAEGEQP